jgi:hypothetical protein
MPLKTCSKGHTFTKTTDCPACPQCEKERKPTEGFMSTLSAPARRALENKKIKSLKQLAKFSEKEIRSLHGIGPSSIPVLKAALKEEGLSFAQKK